MKYFYIDLKTKLDSTSIRTILHYSGRFYQLVNAETGDFILRLPVEIDVEQYDGVVYEDEAISIRC